MQSSVLGYLLYKMKPYSDANTNSKLILQEIVLNSLDIILLLVEIGVTESDYAKYFAGYLMIGFWSLLLAYNFYFVMKHQVAGWITACKLLKKVKNYFRNRKRYKNKIQKGVKRDILRFQEMRGARMNNTNYFLN